MAEPKRGQADQNATKVITSKVRLSYVHAWEAVAMEGSTDKKYSVSIIIPKTETELLDRIRAAIKVATEQGKASKFGNKVPANLKQPLRDGDKDRPESPEYAEAMFVTASSKTKPGIVDKDRQPIIDETEVYSGIYGRVSINFYPFNSNGSKGIACGLNHIQKLEDGEPLGGRGRAEDDFADEEDDLV